MIQEKKEEQEELSLEFLDKLEEKREQQKKEYKKQLMRIVLSSICFTLITGILILFLERLIRWYHYQKMNVEQKYLVQVKRNLKLLSKLGLVRKEEETIEEFEKRIRMELSEEHKFYFLELHEKFLYGTFEIDEESIQLVLQEQEKLLQIFCCFNLFFDKINKIRKGVDL